VGFFLAVTAFRTEEIPSLQQAIRDSLAAKKVRFEVVPVSRAEQNAKLEVRIHAPDNGWSVVQWPTFFGLHDIPLSAILTSTLECTASTVHVYSGAYWVHTLIEAGRILDRFCSRPDYFDADDNTKASLRKRYRGNPGLITKTIKASSADMISPYLVHLNPASTYGKAQLSDAYAIDDPWVFTDFWRRAGIAYPKDTAQPVLRLDLETGYSDKLPMDDEPQAL
jgi:hypothetical protein